MVGQREFNEVDRSQNRRFINARSRTLIGKLAGESQTVKNLLSSWIGP